MSRGTIVILVAEDYEDLEVWYPKLRLEEAGYEVKLVAAEGPLELAGKHGYPCRADGYLSELDEAAVAGVIAPGGWAPDKLRRDPRVLAFVRAVHERGKLVAAICHGPWVLISAGILRGKRVTSSLGIRDDLTNAGAEWLDEPAVVDGSLVTARVPKDLPAFARAMLAVLELQAVAE
jgi:protease I